MSRFIICTLYQTGCHYTIVMALHEIMNICTFAANSINSSGISLPSVLLLSLYEKAFFKELLETPVRHDFNT